MSSPATEAELRTRAEAKVEQFIELISGWIRPLGYQVIHLEIQSHRQKTLRIFIDFVNAEESKAIGIEDCVKVSRTIDQLLDENAAANDIISGAYELEVSSPGADRPLRSISDFQKFSGQQARIHLYRPLTSSEMGNDLYFEKSPKQKNFIGTLSGVEAEQVFLTVLAKDKKGQKVGQKNKKTVKKQSKAQKASLETNSVEGTKIRIPLPLISKANLEPDFNFEASEERE